MDEIWGGTESDLEFFFLPTLPPAMLESLDTCRIEAVDLDPEQLSPSRLTGNASLLGAFSCSE